MTSPSTLSEARSAELTESLVALAKQAGAAIMEIYRQGADAAEVTTKSDMSPLTAADQASHHIIVAGLRALTPAVPVISEEDLDHGEAQAGLPADCWMVDPLDGTKEYIKRTGEFTVNIARLESGRPVVGVVHAPALGTTWLGSVHGAERRDDYARVSIRVHDTVDVDQLRIVASRDHAGPLVTALLARLPSAQTLSMGSSLKFCLVAEGRADLYLRDGPTMAWDTAAAQAVLEAAGGAVLDLSGAPLRCVSASTRNPYFVAIGSSQVPWRQLMQLTSEVQ